MNLGKTTFLSIRKALLYAEWTILFFTFLVVTLNGDTGSGYSPLPDIAIYALLSGMTLLSFIFPVNRPLWQRRAYVFIEMLLILPSRITEWNLEIIMYFFIAKSCFLLSRKDLAIAIVFTGIAWISTNVWSVPGKINYTLSHHPKFLNQSLDTNQIITAVIINEIGLYIAVSTFVILLSFVVLAEQRSRLKAVALAKQVESLAANLERNRIARDIHDSLGHILTTLDVQLELSQRLYQSQPKKALQALNTAKHLTSQSLAEVRRALQTMRDEDFDLNSALVTLIEQVKQNYLFQIEMQVSLPPMPLQTSHQLYCIVQEGLTNIQKHARATRIRLWGQKTADGAILELEDDGVGFDRDLPHSGFGLRGMQERVQILGGQLKIDSVLGQGTRIQAIIPL